MTEAIIPTDVVAKPSLLRQIVDEADALDDEGKKEILRKINMQKALALAKKSDELLKGKTKDYLTEDEIADIVSEDRRSHYKD